MAEFRDEFGDERVMSVLMDAGDREQIDHALAAAEERFGPVDVLINNAAVNSLKKVGDMSHEEWDWAIGVNLSGPWYLCRAVLPKMAELGRGSIVNVTSVAGYIHGTNEGPLRRGQGRTPSTDANDRHGVRARWHPMQRGRAGHHPHLVRPTSTRRRCSTRCRARRSGDLASPEDIANVIAWLVSDQSSFVTGECVNASGGWYMRP